MAHIQNFRGNCLYAFYSAGNILFDRIVVIHQINGIHTYHILGLVTVHIDFLGDDALFFLHIFFGKMGMPHKLHEQLEALLEMIRTGKIVICPQKTGGRIGAGTQCQILVHYIHIRLFK